MDDLYNRYVYRKTDTFGKPNPFALNLSQQKPYQAPV